MKKKLVLVVAVILIAVTACALLVGCVPNRPDKFVATWLKSKNKGAVVEMSIPFIGKISVEAGIDGNKMSLKIGEDAQFIFVNKSSKVVMYAGAKTGNEMKWTSSEIEKDKADSNDNFNQINDILNDNEDVKALVEKLQNAFEENYTENDGWWSANGDVTSYKVDGNKLLTKIGNAESPLKLILNYKISIPKVKK